MNDDQENINAAARRITRSLSNIVVESEIKLKVATENGYDLVINRLIAKPPESFTEAESLISHLQTLKDSVEEYGSDSLRYCRLLKTKGNLNDFRLNRRQRQCT